MMRRDTLVGLAVLGALALNTAPAVAQVESGSQEVHAYGGELFGDDGLEGVDVDHQEAERVAESSRPADLLSEAHVEVPAIAHLGQLVGV